MELAITAGVWRAYIDQRRLFWPSWNPRARSKPQCKRVGFRHAGISAELGSSRTASTTHDYTRAQPRSPESGPAAPTASAGVGHTASARDVAGSERDAPPLPASGVTDARAGHRVRLRLCQIRVSQIRGVTRPRVLRGCPVSKRRVSTSGRRVGRSRCRSC